MTKTLFILICMLMMSMPFYSVNHLDVMTYMSGEFDGSEFGNAMASLDFNNDGYQDLVVSSQAWNPNLVFGDQNYWGKLYFFWGGPGFDNIPDFVIEGSHVHQLGSVYSLYNAGDMNGDGIEDLVLNQKSITYNDQITVYFGRDIPQGTPDVIYTFPYPEIDGIKIAPLGDITGDGLSDITITAGTSNARLIYIWTDINSQPWLFNQTHNCQTASFLSGIGDVNGDGLDDCLLHMPIYSTGETHNRIVVYYGSQTFPQADSLVILEDTNGISNKWGCAVGDVNGDGIDDFTADSNILGYTHHLWLGSDSLTANWDVTLSGDYYSLQHQFNESGTGYPIIHGDLNGDGFEDIVSFNHVPGYFSGYIYLWLGKAQMDGYMDFLQLGMNGYNSNNFGWSKVTGDFNADGLCDIAVGAPWWGENDHNETGRVYILSGNANLTDMVGIDDLETVPISQLWELTVYPNPIQMGKGVLNLSLTGLGYKSLTSAKVSICNPKGQTVYSTPITARELKSGAWQSKQLKLGSGVYLVSIKDGGKTLVTKKVVVVR